MSRRLTRTRRSRCLRARFESALVQDGDELLRYSLELFRFIATGGADHLSGQHLGLHATGRHSIDELRQDGAVG